jgi:nucleoside 2-deoxyribosyltransferase
MKIYLIGSLRNFQIPLLAAYLRKNLCPADEVFDDWYAAGPEADDKWMEYEKDRGHTFIQALDGYAATHVYEFDKTHLDSCDVAVMVMPAGKSAHLELGYCAGKDKRTIILMKGEPERFDVMYKFADHVVTSWPDLLNVL